MSIKFIQLPPCPLEAFLNDSDTSFDVAGFIYNDRTTPVAIADIGDICYATIEPRTDRAELISFTIDSVTAGGVATITAVRGLSQKSPYGTGGAAFEHQGGVNLVISNNPGLFNKLAAKANNEAITGNWTVPTPASPTSIVNKTYADTLDGETVKKTGDQTIAGIKTFTSSPVIPAPVDPLQAVTKKYVDDLGGVGAPNASETTKGIVEIATDAEMASGAVLGTTGAALVPSPSQINQSYTATAGEDINKGQPLSVGDGLDTSKLVSIEETTGGTENDDVTTTEWAAQKVVIPIGLKVTSISFYSDTAQSQTAYYAIRSTLTGANLTTGSALSGSTSGIAWRTVSVTDYTLIEGNTYYILYYSSNDHTLRGVNGDNYSDGEAYISTDSGASWVTHPTIADWSLILYGARTQVGRLYLSSADTYTNFAGFATEDVSKGDSVASNTAKYIKGLFNVLALTAGQKYYFSATEGDMDTSGSDLIGIATSTDDLLRLG